MPPTLKAISCVTRRSSPSEDTENTNPSKVDKIYLKQPTVVQELCLYSIEEEKLSTKGGEAKVQPFLRASSMIHAKTDC